MNTARDYRSVLLHYFLLGRTATESHRKLVQTHGENAPSLHTCFNWFTRFKRGDYNLEHQPHPGRPSSRVRGRVLRELKANPKSSVRDIEKTIHIPKTTVARILHDAGKTPKLPQVIPHDLTTAQLKKRVDVCQGLLHRRSNFNWVSHIVAMDEKWITYDNPERKLQWVDVDEKPQQAPKAELHGKKELLCFFFSVLGPIYWEILPPGITIKADLFTTQLEEVAVRVPPKLLSEGKILMLMDNARPHHAKITQKKMDELEMEWLPHPPYSPDLSPCDYHCFRSLSNFCRGKKFKNRDALVKEFEAWINSKPQAFWKRGIETLPDRWRQVVTTKGAYIDY